MKRLTILFTLLLILLVSACSPGSSTNIPIPLGVLPSPNDIEAPDDIVISPGGRIYRANLHEVGVENPWPSIPSDSVNLTLGSETITVYYRAPFEAKAMGLHTDIITIVRKDAPFINDEKLVLYAVNVSKGINITNGGKTGLMGTVGAVMVIIIEPDVAPGTYTSIIGIEIDGRYYGTIPCTINIVPQ